MSSPSLTRIRERLSAADTLSDAPAGLLSAAVLAPLFLAAGEAHLLFTQRTHTVRDHQGQISFPGGVQDREDQDLLSTALRETEEEIGLTPRVVEVLGALNPVATVTGYWITPFVGLIPHPYDFRLNPLEVKRLLIYPVKEFFPPERWSTGDYHYQGQVVRVCCWHLGGTTIWGATARIVLNLLARLGETPLPDHPGCLD